jgi:hypothetical protein
MTTITLQIKHSSGKAEQVSAEVLWTDGKFATHAAPSYVNTSGVAATGGFCATHVASGASVSLVMPTEAHARVFAQWLSGLDCDWSVKSPDLSKLPKCLTTVRDWVRKLAKAPTLNTVKIKARTLAAARITRLPGA